MGELPPLSLYVHIPWCIRKCPYCDFNSHQLRGRLDEAGYIDALLTDLSLDLRLSGDRPLHSIFIGGGTPSLFAPASIGRLLIGIKARLPWIEPIEITLEANPGTLEATNFAGYRDAGVNRLSIGVQSFDRLTVSCPWDASMGLTKRCKRWSTPDGRVLSGSIWI